MQHLHPRTVELVVGVQGSGKTLLANELVFDHDRIIIVDQRDEYSVGQAFTDFEAMALEAEKRERFVFVWKGDPKHVNDIFHLAFALERICILLEEATLYPMEEHPLLRKAVLFGRKPARISIIANTQRPQLLEPDYRSQVTHVWAFRNSELSALQWLRSYFGAQIQEIAELPPLRGKVWTWGGEPVIRDFAVKP